MLIILFHEVCTKYIAGTIAEELTKRSEEELETHIISVEGHEEFLPREYYFEIGRDIDSE